MLRHCTSSSTNTGKGQGHKLGWRSYACIILWRRAPQGRLVCVSRIDRSANIVSLYGLCYLFNLYVAPKVKWQLILQRWGNVVVNNPSPCVHDGKANYCYDTVWLPYIATADRHLFTYIDVPSKECSGYTPRIAWLLFTNQIQIPTTRGGQSLEIFCHSSFPTCSVWEDLFSYVMYTCATAIKGRDFVLNIVELSVSIYIFFKHQPQRSSKQLFLLILVLKWSVFIRSVIN